MVKNQGEVALLPKSTPCYDSPRTDTQATSGATK